MHIHAHLDGGKRAKTTPTRKLDESKPPCVQIVCISSLSAPTQWKGIVTLHSNVRVALKLPPVLMFCLINCCPSSNYFPSFRSLRPTDRVCHGEPRVDQCHRSLKLRATRARRSGVCKSSVSLACSRSPLPPWAPNWVSRLILRPGQGWTKWAYFSSAGPRFGACCCSGAWAS